MFICNHMLMVGVTSAFCAPQLERTVKMFLSPYAKWTNGSQIDRETVRLETALTGNEAKAADKINAPASNTFILE
ncbi:Bbp50 [Burkholderia sp. YI23]|nr:Bbp50 [Burkholderia sp. YI23]